MNSVKNFNIITIFPDAFPGVLNIGLIGKAFKNNTFNLNIIDLKKFSKNSRVDDRPCGGGPGMVIRPEILAECFDSNGMSKETIFFLSPRGIVFNQSIATEMSKLDNINLLCGRYEGIDQRLFYKYNIVEISIGDYILCGGEVAAMVLIESVVRLYPNVLNNTESATDESFSNFLLENDCFTKPNIWESFSVPDILLSGNHQEIQKWKLENSITKTIQSRYDLYIKYTLSLIIVKFFLWNSIKLK